MFDDTGSQIYPYQMKMNLTRLLTSIKKENQSIAIVVEGGGLRGVVSAAMLSVFEDFDLLQNVKAISGTSSGALNAAYFLNKNTSSVLELYRKMASTKFIQPWRWPNAMNLSYLFDYEILRNHPIDYKSLISHPTDFHIALTNTNTGRGEYHLARASADEKELLQALRASASAPLFSTNTEIIGGNCFNDGHVELAIPLSSIDIAKYDKIFCLLTQKEGYKKRPKKFSTLLGKVALRRYSHEYQNSFKKADETYNRQMEESKKSPQLIPLMLSEEDFIVSKMCLKPSEIQKCIDGVRAKFLE